MKIKLTRISLAVFLGLGFVTALIPEAFSQQANWEKVLVDARKEGKVSVWGPPGALIRQNIVAAFGKAFPQIELEWQGIRSSAQAAKLQSERRGGLFGVDVLLTGTTTALTSHKPNGFLDPIRPTLILPEVTDPKNWLNNTIEYADEGGYSLAFVNFVLPRLAYNPEQVKPDEVDELREVLDPKWTGKIVVYDPIPAGAGHAFARWLWERLGPAESAKYLKALKAQAGAVSRETRTMLEWVGSGKYAIATNPDVEPLEQLLKLGLKIGIQGEFKDYGSEITPASGTIVLVNRAPHPSAARVFINWLLTKDGQTVWSVTLNQASRRVDVPTGHLPSYTLPKPGRKYDRFYFEKYVAKQPELEKLLADVFGK
jgi:ABC-type Fe3+ transport system substrate-binding protein